VNKSERADHYIKVVQHYADRAIELGRDRYGSIHTPLFVDGIHVSTHEPVQWLSDGEQWIISNFANQQNWMRTLVGLSKLGGDSKYEEIAEDALQFVFRHASYGDLLCWGGHMAYDLLDKKQVYASDKGPQHELKCHFPYYEWMFAVDANRTRAYIEAVWNSHITDWGNLEFSRHGQPVISRGDGVSIWDRNFESGDVFFTAKGLTFINAGSDLIYGAAMLSEFTGQEKPLQWAKRLAQRYVETRHPETGLGGYQFSISVLPGIRGDRAIEQFGEQLKEHAPIEATLSVGRQIHTIIGESALCKLILAERLGDRGREFAAWAIEDLLAYGKYSYDSNIHSFHPMLSNGTRLTGLVMEKSGYYGKAGDTLPPVFADFKLLWSYVKGYRSTRSQQLWDIAKSIAEGNGFGNIGNAGAEGNLEINMGTQCTEPTAIFAVLELYQATGKEQFLELAMVIANNLIEHRLIDGLFLPSPHHLYANFDCAEPLALMHLAGELLGRRKELPSYLGGTPFFGAAYDGLGHTKDTSFYYGRTM
jgi:pectate lyase